MPSLTESSATDVSPPSERPPEIAIVDLGIGNMFSVRHACAYAGMRGTITASKDTILSAEAVLLPGMGSFGDAMAALRRHDLVAPLKDIAASGKYLVGICLGMQLLLRQSCEFGTHQGLGIVDGTVERFDPRENEDGSRLKVPLVGWNRISKADSPSTVDGWEDSPLRRVENGAYMYFVHSYFARPDDIRQVLCLTDYGDVSFCSGLRIGNVIGLQFHPERSGPAGLCVYEELRSLVVASRGLGEEAP